MVHSIDQQAVDTIRVVAADMTRGANSGHPGKCPFLLRVWLVSKLTTVLQGAPMGCAPMAHAVFTRHLNVNPKNPKFINRDRFVLSNGHGCALQYILLHLMGFDLTLQDLKNFRQVGSKYVSPRCTTLLKQILTQE